MRFLSDATGSTFWLSGVGRRRPQVALRPLLDRLNHGRSMLFEIDHRTETTIDLLSL